MMIMKKMTTHIIPSVIVAVIVVLMFPQVSKAYNFASDSKIEFENVVNSSTEIGLIDPTNDNEYMLLTDVKVASKLIDDNTIELTLTNTGAFVVTDWSVAYKSEYGVLTIENAKIVSDSEVVEFKSVDANDALASEESTTVTLTINGTYCDNINYRVYGLQVIK